MVKVEEIKEKREDLVIIKKQRRKRRRKRLEGGCPRLKIGLIPARGKRQKTNFFRTEAVIGKTSGR
jgi:hypothetical protein